MFKLERFEAFCAAKTSLLDAYRSGAAIVSSPSGGSGIGRHLAESSDAAATTLGRPDDFIFRLHWRHQWRHRLHVVGGRVANCFRFAGILPSGGQLLDFTDFRRLDVDYHISTCYTGKHHLTNLRCNHADLPTVAAQVYSCDKSQTRSYLGASITHFIYTEGQKAEL